MAITLEFAERMIDNRTDAYYDAKVYIAFAQAFGYDETDQDAIVVECDESYSGQFESHEDFAQDLAEQLGMLDTNASWPQTCIDWHHAADEIMYDYTEQDGYYFRNI